MLYNKNKGIDGNCVSQWSTAKPFSNLFYSETIGVVNTDHFNELPESEEYHSNRESFEYNSFF